MTSVRLVFLLIGGLLIGAGNAASETADCRAQLKQQDEQCQALAERRAEACPGGESATQSPACKQLSAQIANTCTRKPCAPPPRKKAKAKAKAKSKGMAGGAMGASQQPKAAPAKSQ